ncbi:hypothetical protein [Lysobacter gummosus]|uniref:hypothetical protein n=1 Tax=Lysobacter gummosus TaxID=262324 RepID=UPI0036423192
MRIAVHGIGACKAGAAWLGGPVFPVAAGWNAEVTAFARRLASPRLSRSALSDEFAEPATFYATSCRRIARSTKKPMTAPSAMGTSA